MQRKIISQEIDTSDSLTAYSKYFLKFALWNYKNFKNQNWLHCTVVRKAYILSGSGFHEFLYSIIESLKKNREIAGFIPNPLRFHKKTESEGRRFVETGTGKNKGFLEQCAILEI